MKDLTTQYFEKQLLLPKEIKKHEYLVIVSVVMLWSFIFINVLDSMVFTIGYLLFSVNMLMIACPYLEKLFYRMLFTFNKEKELIVNEVNAFIEVNQKEKKASLRMKQYIQFPTFENLEQWVRDNFPEGRAFRELFYKYCIKNESGAYDKALVVWSRIVPYKRLGKNTALEVLRCCKLNPIFQKDVEDMGDVEYYFSEYTDKQIKNLFYSSFDADKYLKLVTQYTNRSKEPFPVLSRMTDLMDYMEFYGTNNIIFKEPAIDLSGETSETVIYRIKNFKTLFKRAEEFRNCAKSYINRLEKGSCFMYIVDRKENPIMFHVGKNNKVLEAKYKCNRYLSKEDKDWLDHYIKNRIKEV